MEQNVRANVEGMHCAACSARIERVVRKMEGVAGADVNLATEELRVDFDDQVLSFADIAQKIATLGFHAEQKAEARNIILDLQVGGMHCAACSSRIERVVAAMDGVLEASVNLATERGHFVYDHQRIGARGIREKIEQLGFSSQPLNDEDSMGLQQMDKSEQLRLEKRKLIAELVLVVPLLLLSMGHMLGLPLPRFLAPGSAPRLFALSQCVLAVAIMVLGSRFYRVGIPALLRRGPNMDSLIAVGTGAAFIYSCWSLIEIFLEIQVQERVMDLYFESVGVLIALVSLGKYLELRSKNKSGEAIRMLMECAPKEAVLLQGEEQRVIPAAEIEVGDLLLIRPGAQIPADGCVARGSAILDESLLTGEAMPVRKEQGEPVFGGTVNGADGFVMRAEKTGGATVLAGIVRMVSDAQGSKPHIARVADQVSYYFVPVVMTIALCVGLLWYCVGDVGFASSLRFFIAVMVIACPCAMGLATPISVMVGTGRGAQLGILIKNGQTLELLEKTQVLLFDKTGTITEGRPEVERIIPVQSGDEAKILGYVAAAEAVSEHPLASAIIRYYDEKMCVADSVQIPQIQADQVQNYPGRGIIARQEGTEIMVGNRDFCVEICAGPVASYSPQHGATVLYVAINKEFAGHIIIADRIRGEASEVIEQLKEAGITPVMLTGDAKETADAVARQVGINEVVAAVLPEGKADLVRTWQKKGATVAMVGDGINDAPALALADVGIAMGTGIDIAMESGDAVIMHGDLRRVLLAIELSRAVMKNIRQNLFWAFGYNVIGIPVAAGLLAIFGGPQLNPMLAGAAMAASSVSVVSNALRLRFFSGTAGKQTKV